MVLVSWVPESITTFWQVPRHCSGALQKLPGQQRSPRLPHGSQTPPLHTEPPLHIDPRQQFCPIPPHGGTHIPAMQLKPVLHMLPGQQGCEPPPQVQVPPHTPFHWPHELHVTAPHVGHVMGGVQTGDGAEQDPHVQLAEHVSDPQRLHVPIEVGAQAP